jgi:hypothetical protein
MVYTPKNQVGQGTTLSWTPTGGTLKPFVSLVSVTPPAATVGEVESNIISAVFKPYLPTIPEAEGSFKIEHWDGDPACVAMQSACMSAPTPSGVFLITLPSGATLSIPGFPKKYAINETQREEIITADVDFRQIAPATYTPPA